LGDNRRMDADVSYAQMPFAYIGAAGLAIAAEIRRRERERTA